MQDNKLYNFDIYAAGKIVSSIQVSAPNKVAAQNKVMAQIKLKPSKVYPKKN